MRFVLTIIAFCVSYLGLNYWVSKPTMFEAEWEKTELGWVAQEIAPRQTEYCICPAYECETMIESTMIADDGSIFGRRFRYIASLDENDRPSYMEPRTPRPVSGNNTCIKKQKGEALKISLVEEPKYLWLKLE